MSSTLNNSNASAAEQRGVLSTLDLLELLWRRKLPIAMGMLVGVLLGLLYYMVTPTMYESQVDVLIVPKRPQALTNDQQYESGFEDFVATHRALIVSPLIVERAIEAGDLQSLETFADLDAEEDDLVETIILDLEAGGGSRDLGDDADSIMTLTFRGTIAEECPLVVEAIVNSYRSFLDETYRGMSDDVLLLIQQARDLLQNDLESHENEYIEFRQGSPMVARGVDEVNPLQDRLAAIEAQRSVLLIRRTQIQGQLTTIQNATRDEFDNEQLLALVSDMRQRTQAIDGFVNASSTTLDAQLIQLADREQQLMEYYGPKHPHVSTIRERIDQTRKLQALPTAAHILPANSEHEATSVDAAEFYSQFLRQELERIDTSEQLLTKLYQREHAMAKELAGYQLKDERYQRDIARTQQLYDGVISQFQEASLVKGIGGFEARAIAPPKLGKKSSPRLTIVGAASVFLGLCFGFGVALLMEYLDKSFHSHQEVQARLGWPVLGQIPHFTSARQSDRGASENEAPLDSMLFTHFQPQSPQCEAIRALRTALFFSNREQDLGVVQLTGPSAVDGASALTANLAISLANLGQRVLLLDADLRRPEQHKLFGVSADKGLCEVLAGNESARDAVCATAIDNLWLLPTGPIPANGSELLVKPRFRQMLSSFRDEYDCVLIDSGPLLEAADPGVIAAQADGVLVVLRLNSDSRERADRAQEILDMLNVKTIGVVVNSDNAASSERQ